MSYLDTGLDPNNSGAADWGTVVQEITPQITPTYDDSYDQQIYAPAPPVYEDVLPAQSYDQQIYAPAPELSYQQPYSEPVFTPISDPVQDVLPVDPSMGQQFGFGATGVGLEHADPSVPQQFGFGTEGNRILSDREAADFYFNRAGQPEPQTFENTQFPEQNTGFDYTTDPANRNDLDPIGDALGGAIDLYNTRIPIWSDFARDYLKPAFGTAMNPLSPLTMFDNPLQGYAKLLSEGWSAAVPETAGDVALTVLPGAAVARDRGLAAGLSEAFGAGSAAPVEALDELPAAALRGAVRRFPESPGMAPDVANAFRRAAGASDEIEDAARVAGPGPEVSRDILENTPTEAAAPATAGNINLTKFPEESRPAIAGWAATHADEAEAARRGVIPDAQVAQMARQLVEDTGGDWTKLQNTWAPGKAYNAEEIVALGGALADKAAEVSRLAQAAQLDDSVANHTALIEAMLEQADLQRIVHGGKAEQGRGLRANRQVIQMLKNQGAEAEAVRKALDEAGMDRTKIENVAKMLTSGELSTPAKVNAFIRNINKPNFWDKLHFYWMNSILSGPITQARNIVGNGTAALYSPFERIGAAAVEQPLARIQGRQAQRFWQEAPASFVGIFQGIPQGVDGALKTLRTGISPRMAAKLDTRPAPISGPAGRVLGFPTTMLGMADEFFSAINERSILNATAVRKARAEGLRGDALQERIAQLLSNPTPDMTKLATEGTDRLLFRGEPGGHIYTGLSILRKAPGGRYVLPFLRTPANLLKYGVENSPLGLLNTSAWQKAIAGNPEGADELARAFMGSAVAATVSAGVASGAIDITAAAPVDKAERDAFFRSGKIPFAIKLPGAGWVEYKSIPLFDTTLTLVASAVDGIRRGDDVGSIAAQAGANIGSNLFDKSYMSGIGDLIDAVQDPARYAEQYATRQASGYVPFSGLQRQVTGFIDPKLRDAQGIQEQIQSQIPGLSSKLPARLDAFGNEVDRKTPSPVLVSAESQSAVDAELERVGADVNFVGRTVVAQTREEKYVYQAVAGQVTYKVLEALFASPAYQGLTQAQQQEAIDKAVNKSREQTRKKLEPVFEKRRAEAVK